MADAELEERVRRTVVLVVSELVTNAIQHGEPPYGIVVDVYRDLVKVDVVDHGGQIPVPPLDGVPDDLKAGDLRSGGRGLAIVRRLAAAWGVERAGDGSKDVWADVPAAAGG
ncbi:MAG: ATP-binding protein [Nocardioidaceae bacterium]|nr:ATP-binding protein [Nocardioidaceae bacterium]